MEIVAKTRPKELSVEAGTVFAGKSRDGAPDYLMVIEDHSDAHVFERYALLDLATGRLRSGWTNDATIRKMLTEQHFGPCSDAALHLTVDAEE